MLIHNTNLRDLDSLFNQVVGRPANEHPMPLDAYRRGEDVWVHLDLPGVDPASLDIDVERSVLTVAAERDWNREEGDQLYLSERPRGAFRRQVSLGEGLDPEGIEAEYHDGVLTLRIPVAEKAKPRKIEVKTGNRDAIDVDASD